MVAVASIGGAAPRKRMPRRDPLRVTPSEAIEAHVRAEIAKAEAILKDPGPENLFDSPYLVSAVYYHDGFLATYPTEKADGDPARRIIGHLARQLTAEAKARYLYTLNDYARKVQPEFSARFTMPVACEMPRRSRRTHQYAVDLFAREGSAVRSASDGVVILAEGAWAIEDPLSVSSREGGNTVIVYDAEAARFYRYCHLERALVRAGDPATAGRPIGVVGHTGLNASRKGHGGHLHFEINQYDGRSVRPLNYLEIREVLSGAG